MVVLLASVWMVSSSPGGSARATPELLELAATRPATKVNVIVQKLTHEQTVERHLALLGGSISMDLPIVNGFVSTMSAGAAAVLAQDANVRWISLDTPVVSHACTGTDCIDPDVLASAFVRTIGADKVWNRSPAIRGQGIGVAILDSGIIEQSYLYTRWTNRVVAKTAFNNGFNTTTVDWFGHGTQVAGIIGANGDVSQGKYVGVAPAVNLINVKVSDDFNQGTATASSMVAGMQWVYNNKDTYNIRVINISLTDSVVESYNVSVLAAAAEALWARGIVVVAAAGNTGEQGAGKIAAPANDPFVITVGAADDHGTASPSDDTIPRWSSFGPTLDGFAKPDLVAPGVNLVTMLPSQSMVLAKLYPGNITMDTSTGYKFFRMSGTSMAAPVVSGAVALLLQDEPNLTPNQVKYRLMATTSRTWFGDDAKRSGAGLLDIQRAIDATTTQAANAGVAVSALNSDGNTPTSMSSSTAKWSTAKWSTAKWSTAKWSTMNP